MAATDPQRPPQPGSGEDDLSLSDILDRAFRRLSAAIVLGSIIGGLALYWRAPPPRYEAVVVGGQVVRLDTKTGSMIACDGAKCFTVVRRGQKLARPPAEDRLLAQPAQAPPAAAAAVPAPPAPAKR